MQPWSKDAAQRHTASPVTTPLHPAGPPRWPLLLQVHSRPVTVLAFDPRDSHKLYSSSYDNTVAAPRSFIVINSFQSHAVQYSFQSHTVQSRHRWRAAVCTRRMRNAILLVCLTGCSCFVTELLVGLHLTCV